MTKWQELAARFQKLSDITGREKSSSFIMNVIFSPDDGVAVELGTYDIEDWPRHLYLGPFTNEDMALIGTEQKIVEAEAIVAKGAKEGKYEQR